MTADRDVYTAKAGTREDAHTAASIAYKHAMNLLNGGFKSVVIECKPEADTISVRMRGFFHGAVLKQIAEQVALPVFDNNGNDTGQRARYKPQVWKEYFVGMFLARWEARRGVVLDKTTGKPRPSRRPVPKQITPSTETLGPPAYAEFVDKVIAYATADLGVAFEFRTQSELEMQAYIAELKRRGAEA